MFLDMLAMAILHNISLNLTTHGQTEVVQGKLLRHQTVSSLRAKEPGCARRKLAQSLCGVRAGVSYSHPEV